MIMIAANATQEAHPAEPPGGFDPLVSIAFPPFAFRPDRLLGQVLPGSPPDQGSTAQRKEMWQVADSTVSGILDPGRYRLQ
jgi:hypothetical protein